MNCLVQFSALPMVFTGLFVRGNLGLKPRGQASPGAAPTRPSASSSDLKEALDAGAGESLDQAAGRQPRSGVQSWLHGQHRMSPSAVTSDQSTDKTSLSTKTCGHRGLSMPVVDHWSWGSVSPLDVRRLGVAVTMRLLSPPAAST